MDARQAVASETTDKWLNETFAVPMTLRVETSEPQRNQRVTDSHAAILHNLPRNMDRVELLALCEAARVNLVRASKYATWPTVSELISAFKIESAKANASNSSDWPHSNSEYVISSTAAWIRKFDEWPGYMAHPSAVATELVERGEFTADELRSAGYDPNRLQVTGPEGAA